MLYKNVLVSIILSAKIFVVVPLKSLLASCEWGIEPPGCISHANNDFHGISSWLVNYEKRRQKFITVATL